MEVVGYKTHILTDAGFKKSIFVDYVIYSLDDPTEEAVNKAAIAVFENGELKAVAVPIEDVGVLEEMDRSKFQFRGIKS